MFLVKEKLIVIIYNKVIYFKVGRYFYYIYSVINGVIIRGNLNCI